MKVALRPAKQTPEELLDCTSIITECFGNKWVEDFSACFLSQAEGRGRVYVATIDRRIVAVLFIAPEVIAQGFYSITWICVAPRFRKKGIASLLIKHAIDKHKRVFNQHTNALSYIQLVCLGGLKNFYKKLGFESIDTLDHEFIIMRGKF